MSACIFIGPSLRPEDRARLEEDMEVLPPVALGDVWRAVQRRPRAIGIVDGYFDGVPAVWHKEILFALARGVHVFGSASMGALRAAELARFGMIGVGAIFEAYRDGGLADDDEVAVLHGPAETGFLPLSEPMVNVRATLARAEDEHVIDGSLRDRVQVIAKEVFYRERTWDLVLERAARAGITRADLERLAAWLPEGRIDRKRDDALAMVEAMRALLAGEPGPRPVDFHFEWTAMWEDAVRAFEAAGGPAVRTGAPAGAAVLEELKLRPGAWQAARAAAQARLWASREAGRRRTQPSDEEIGRVLRGLRERHGLLTREALETWLQRNGFDVPALERLVAEEAGRALLERRSEVELGQALVDHLRIEGAFGELSARARAKRERLQEIGATDADPELIGMPALSLRRWFFEHHLGQPLPEDVGAFARASGFADLAEFDGALAREYLYAHRAAEEGEAAGVRGLP